MSLPSSLFARAWEKAMRNAGDPFTSRLLYKLLTREPRVRRGLIRVRVARKTSLRH